MNEHQEILTTKLALIVGGTAAGLTLADIDLMLSISLKVVSIISFMVIIVLNVDKLIAKIKTWFK